MNARVHRSLTILLAALAAVSAPLSATNTEALGLDPLAWAWCAFLLPIAIAVVTAVRQVWETE